jgi:gliding motility-associated protein GldE
LEDPDPYLLDFLPQILTVFLPLSGNMAIALAVVVLLLLLVALFSAAETAFFSLGPLAVQELKEHEAGSSRRVARLLEQPRRLLATILIVNTFAKVTAVIVSTWLALRLAGPGQQHFLVFLVEVVVITALILLLGEVMPKIYATQRASTIAKLTAPLLSISGEFCRPLASVLVRSTDWVDERYARKGHNLSMSELNEAIDLTTNDSAGEEDRRILKGIVKFSDMDVKEIMKSRVDVSAVDTSLNFRELLKFILDAGYSRIPAYDESFDRVVGILYIKDLLPHLSEDEDFAWQSMLRPAFFVPEGKPINELLKEFQARKIHMAIVVDEYGGTSGIVTLEDIIEEIVGEISDEFDLESEGLSYRQVSENSWIFEGKASLNDFCKVAGIEDRIFEVVKGESDTLAGLILELEGRIPPRNAVIRYEQFTFRIEEADPRRIHSVRVTINKDEDED